MRSNNRARWCGVSSLESLTPRSARARSRRSRGRITAAATTGPAQAPRPASSTPAIREYPRARIFFSRRRVGICLLLTSDFRLPALPRIQPAGPVAPNEDDIAQHPQRVEQRIDPALRAVIPVDGHFDDAVAAPPGDVQRLHVEAPAAEQLHAEQVAR